MWYINIIDVRKSNALSACGREEGNRRQIIKSFKCSKENGNGFNFIDARTLNPFKCM